MSPAADDPRITRRDEAAFDQTVAAAEHGDPSNTTDPATMRANHERLEAAGLLDPDEPTPWADHVRREVDNEVAHMPDWVRTLYVEAIRLVLPDEPTPATEPAALAWQLSEDHRRAHAEADRLGAPGSIETTCLSDRLIMLGVLEPAEPADDGLPPLDLAPAGRRLLVLDDGEVWIHTEGDGWRLGVSTGGDCFVSHKITAAEAATLAEHLASRRIPEPLIPVLLPRADVEEAIAASWGSGVGKRVQAAARKALAAQEPQT